MTIYCKSKWLLEGIFFRSELLWMYWACVSNGGMLDLLYWWMSLSGLFLYQVAILYLWLSDALWRMIHVPKCLMRNEIIVTRVISDLYSWAMVTCMLCSVLCGAYDMFELMPLWSQLCEDSSIHTDCNSQTYVHGAGIYLEGMKWRQVHVQLASTPA